MAGLAVAISKLGERKGGTSCKRQDHSQTSLLKNVVHPAIKTVH